jgi:hypothetical protein
MFQALADSVKKVTVYQSLLCGCPVVPFSDASASPVRGIRPTGQPTKGIQLALRIKNWEKHQHFKDRRPPWVKLYRDLLENPDWHYLSGDDAKLLVALWLIASEDETKTGLLPDVKRIAFRLRSTEKLINQQLTRLSEWLIHDDINVISERYQVVSPETETETENREQRQIPAADAASVDGFAEFWEAYPKKTGKAAAMKVWAKLKPKPLEACLVALAWQRHSEQWTKDGGQYVPNPSTYLAQGRWMDEPIQIQTKPKKKSYHEQLRETSDALCGRNRRDGEVVINGTSTRLD